MQYGKEFKLIEQISEQSNHALAVSFSGYLFSMGTVLAGLFHGERQGLGLEIDTGDANTSTNSSVAERFGVDVFWAIFGLLMLLLVQLLNDFVFFHQYNNITELRENKNLALAVVEAGIYIGSSFVVAACTHAENVSLAVSFFLCGMAAMVAFSFGYERVTSYDDQAAIKGNNAAAGVDWACNMAAFGLLVSQAVERSNSILVFVIWSAAGSACTLLYRKVIDVTVLREIDLDAELELDAEEAAAGVLPNWGVALLNGVVTISLVQTINTFLRDCEYEFVG